jgi:hypothetical protein
VGCRKVNGTSAGTGVGAQERRGVGAGALFGDDYLRGL